MKRKFAIQPSSLPTVWTNTVSDTDHIKQEHKQVCYKPIHSRVCAWFESLYGKYDSGRGMFGGVLGGVRIASSRIRLLFYYSSLVIKSGLASLPQPLREGDSPPFLIQSGIKDSARPDRGTPLLL
jgi:hypothetical protein